jgi:hypothetical protein
MSVDAGSLIDYALGTISPQGAREVEAHLADRPELAAGLRRMQDGLAEMVLDLPALPVSGADEDALAAAALRHAPKPAGRGSGPLWVALGLALALGLTAWLAFQRLGLWPAETEPAARALEQVLDRDGNQVAVMVRLGGGGLFIAFEGPPPSGEVYRIWSVVGGEVLPLEVSEGRAVHLPVLPAGARLRITRDAGQPVSEPWLELRP